MSKEDEGLSPDELFLDTTYLFPFLQVPIAVKGFRLPNFQTMVRNLSKVHVAELSIYEAKAKLMRLSRANGGYGEALRAFGNNLEALRLDEKFAFHGYEKEADEHFNQFLRLRKHVDAFDLIILSQAANVGELLTEDLELLSFRETTAFVESGLSARIRIRSWKDIASGKRDY